MPVLERLTVAQTSQMTPEYENYSNAPQILSITGAFTGLALLTVVLRSYVRAVMLRYLGADDYLIVVAMILSICVLACFVREAHHGMGKHLVVMVSNIPDYEAFLKLQYVHSLLIMVAVSTVKVSIAMFLLRLAQLFLFYFTTACALSLIFQCIPVQAAWKLSLKPPTGTAKCYDLNIFRDVGLFNSSINIATDILFGVFASLPIPLIWNLQVNKRTKVSLLCILSLGYFASAAAVVKAVKQYHVFADPDWTVGDSFNVWNDIELNIGIMAASLPALKPIFNWFLQTARALTSSMSGGQNTAQGAARPLRSFPGRHRDRSVSKNGYYKQREESSSIALSNIPSSQAYDAKISGGGSGGGSSGSGSSYGMDKGLGGVEVYPQRPRDGESTASGESEKAAPPQRPREGVIYLTREVSVK